MNDKNLKGIWIDGGVWECETLTLIEKLFIQKIKDLDNEKGCFANNAFFAGFFGLSKQRCSQIISSLKSKKLISVKIKYKKGTEQVEKRTLKILKGGVKLFKGGIKDINNPMKNIKGGYKENTKDNNRLINNRINNLVECVKAKDTEIDFLKNEIKLLKKELEKEKEKSSAKKEKENHVFPDITPVKKYEVTRFNPCLTSATGGKEINKKWKTIEALKEDYESSRGINIDAGLVEAAKKSFIESGFNYHKGINTLYKLEDALFRWIDKQKKGLNEQNKNYNGKQSTDNGKSMYENYADILYGRTSEDDNDAIDISWAEA